MADHDGVPTLAETSAAMTALLRLHESGGYARQQWLDAHEQNLRAAGRAEVQAALRKMAEQIMQDCNEAQRR